jgi:uncharacterized phage infection (PIP) family protein YhgE
MSSILDELRERVTQTKAALEKAKEASAKAQAKQTSLEEELKAYSNALRFEERRNGASGPVPTFVPEIRAEADSDRVILVSVNKSDELKRIMRERKDGIAPLDLHAELQKRGVEIGTNYVYGLLYKLRKGGEIRKKGRKFYWVESQEAKAAS